MARPIQRRTKKKKTVLKKSDTDTTINTNMGENQAVQTVKVVIQHPEPEKKKRKPRKKKDSKKDEAIEELKEELQSYDEVQNQAGDAGVDIPAELGVSPAEASALKSADDIKQFIQMIREKKEAIKQLMAGPPPQPARPPNRFIDLPRPGIIPEVPQQVVPAQVVPQQVVPQQPIVRPGIEGQLKALEEAEKRETLKLTKSPSIKRFEEKAEKVPMQINDLLAEIETARKANNGVLTADQLNNFITKMEVIGNNYNREYAKMSAQSQALLQPARERFIESLTFKIRNLKEELRSLTPQPTPTPQPLKKETWNPTYNALSSPFSILREYIRLDLDRVEITPTQAEVLKRAIRGIPQITDAEALIKELETQPDAKKRQSAVREVLEAIKKDEEEASQPIPTPSPPTPAQETAKDQAKVILSNYVDGTGRWSNKIKDALRTIGLRDTEIDRLSGIKGAQGKKDAVRAVLACPPGSRRAGCPLPSPPKQPAVMMAGRNVPRGQAPPAKPQPTVIQTTTYAEYTRLRQQYAGSPNVIVQAPASALTQQSIETKIGLETPINLGRFSTPNQQADLSSSRLPRAP